MKVITEPGAGSREPGAGHPRSASSRVIEVSHQRRRMSFTVAESHASRGKFAAYLPQTAARGRSQPDATGLERGQLLTTCALVRGGLGCWWQVLGSNQRRLSRRFYRPPINGRHSGKFSCLARLGQALGMIMDSREHGSRLGRPTPRAQADRQGRWPFDGARRSRTARRLSGSTSATLWRGCYVA